MNVVFMGTPEFAVPSLMQLMKRHTVRAVVCQPDKPNRRGNRIAYGAVKTFAIENGVKIIQPEFLNSSSFIQVLVGYKPDVIVVAAYGRILPPEILRIPRFGCINVHASLLPKYRGAAPVQWSIINGEEETGVTIMYMNEGLDTGDMLRKRHVVIETSDTYGTLLRKLSIVGAEELIIGLDEIVSGTVRRVIQNDAEATYAPIIEKEIGRIRWEHTGANIVNLIRALNPSPGAFTDFCGKKLKIWHAELFGKSCADADFGEIIDVLRKEGIVVNAGENCVILTDIQLSGSKRMSAQEFLKGRSVELGTILR